MGNAQIHSVIQENYNRDLQNKVGICYKHGEEKLSLFCMLNSVHVGMAVRVWRLGKDIVKFTLSRGHELGRGHKKLGEV